MPGMWGTCSINPTASRYSPAVNSAQSRAAVTGLQETYTIRRALLFSSQGITSSAPARPDQQNRIITLLLPACVGIFRHFCQIGAMKFGINQLILFCIVRGSLYHFIGHLQCR